MTYTITIKKESQVKKAKTLLTNGKWLEETDMHLEGSTFKTTSIKAHETAVFFLEAMGIKILK